MGQDVPRGACAQDGVTRQAQRASACAHMVMLQGHAPGPRAKGPGVAVHLGAREVVSVVYLGVSFYTPVGKSTHAYTPRPAWYAMLRQCAWLGVHNPAMHEYLSHVSGS